MTVDERATEQLSTAPVEDTGTPVGLGVRGWVRWTWRQLTSMRTALLLLFLLALASVPGSVFPQRISKPIEVNEYLLDHPTTGPWLDRLGAFDVFGSAWFSAIYLLLFVSLAGCIVPRTIAHARMLRTAPPPAPRNLGRLPEHRSAEIDDDPSSVLSRARESLRSLRFRVVDAPYDGTSGWVAAEKGYARETGNLVFHLALLVLLMAVALGSLAGYSGKIIVREGSTFANSASQYDQLAAGRYADTADLPPFSFRLDRFTADYQRGGRQDGAPREFSADVTWRPDPDAAPTRTTIGVNDPLEVNGVKLFLVGHGYAPTFTVTDARGQVVFHDSVVFLPQDGMFTSTGVVKVPDTTPQLGLQGFFLPTAAVDATQGPHSTFPAADDPAVFLSAWTGDLGLDAGAPQSVYKLDTARMAQHGIVALRPGQTWQVPSTGLTVRFDGYVQFASFSVARDPGKELALLAALAAMVGLAVSLRVRRRRVWVRVAGGPTGPTRVEVGGLTRGEHDSVADEVDAVLSGLTGTARGTGEQEGTTWTA